MKDPFSAAFDFFAGNTGGFAEAFTRAVNREPPKEDLPGWLRWFASECHKLHPDIKCGVANAP